MRLLFYWAMTILIFFAGCSKPAEPKAKAPAPEPVPNIQISIEVTDAPSLINGLDRRTFIRVVNLSPTPITILKAQINGEFDASLAGNAPLPKVLTIGESAIFFVRANLGMNLLNPNGGQTGYSKQIVFAEVFTNIGDVKYSP